MFYYSWYLQYVLVLHSLLCIVCLYKKDIVLSLCVCVCVCVFVCVCACVREHWGQDAIEVLGFIPKPREMFCQEADRGNPIRSRAHSASPAPAD